MKVKTHKYKFEYINWFDQDCIKAKSEVNIALKKWRKSNDNDNHKNYIFKRSNYKEIIKNKKDIQ